MADVKLYGIKLSSYVRTCILALEEKGVSYELVENAPNSPEQLEHHPFGKVPAFRHGNVHLFETLAICRYVDQGFDGPGLVPADPADGARAVQWASALIDYIYPSLVRDILIQRLVVPMQGGKTDEAVVAAAAKVVDGYLAILDDALAKSDYLAGGSYSVADMFYLPPLANFRQLPEAKLLDNRANLRAWYDRCAQRPSAKAIGIET